MRLPTVNQLKMQNQILASQYEQLSNLQIQSGSGKKLISSSDSPFLADQIKSNQNYLTQLQSYDLSLTLAENRANQKTSIVSQSINLIGRSSELILYAQNEVLNNSDRVVIADELSGILNQLYYLANSRDENGDYLYSGIKANVPPFMKQGNDYIYQGSSELMQIDISPNARINYTDSGYKIFGAIPEGNGIIVTQANSSLNTGTGVISDGSLTNNSTYVADNYTLSFVTNSQNQLAYVITGANSGQVIPALPLNIPADAPQFVAGQPIEFNGMSAVITGQPDNNDSFSIAPSQNQNIFSSLSKLIEVLKTPVGSDKSKADLKQELINFSQIISQANSHFISYQTELGNTASIISNQQLLSENLVNNQKVILGELSNADMGTVISDCTRQMTIIKLTQETYMKIQQVFSSLFDKG